MYVSSIFDSSAERTHTHRFAVAEFEELVFKHCRLLNQIRINHRRVLVRPAGQSLAADKELWDADDGRYSLIIASTSSSTSTALWKQLLNWIGLVCIYNNRTPLRIPLLLLILSIDLIIARSPPYCVISRGSSREGTWSPLRVHIMIIIIMCITTREDTATELLPSIVSASPPVHKPKKL